MAAKRAPRKLRVRTHVLEKVSFNWFEQIVLNRDYSFQRTTQDDYGTDLLLFTYDDDGSLENGHLLVQMKATDAMPREGKDGSWRYSIDTRDLNHWMREVYPVIFVVYTSKGRRGRWIHIQAAFQGYTRTTTQSKVAKLPKSQPVTPIAIDMMRAIKRSTFATIAVALSVSAGKRKA